MRNLFPGYYKPNEDNLAELWESCVFVVDTNVLLAFYRYSENLRNDLLTVLEMLSIKERLWIPHQVALEYLRRRLDVIVEQKSAYEEIIKSLDVLWKNINKEFDREQERHRFIEFGDFPKPIDDAIQAVKQSLQQQQRQHPNWFVNDPIRDKLDVIFDARIGNQLPPDVLALLPQDAERRAQRGQPPGFRDLSKKGNPFGDLIIWEQILAYAKQTQLPIIFVTNDSKDDWWSKAHNDVQPHPELVQEIFEVAHVQFHMYHTDTFLEEAKTRLSLDIEDRVLQDAVQEIRDIREADADREENLEVSDLQAELLSDRVLLHHRFNEDLAAATMRDAVKPFTGLAITGVEAIMRDALKPYAGLAAAGIEATMRDAVKPFTGLAAAGVEAIMRDALKPYGGLATAGAEAITRDALKLTTGLAAAGAEATLRDGFRPLRQTAEPSDALQATIKSETVVSTSQAQKPARRTRKKKLPVEPKTEDTK